MITTEYGKPFSDKSLTGMMAHWTQMAGMKPGATFHGLRKTLGKYLAEEGATAKQAAGILGHDDLDHVALYSKDAEQERTRGRRAFAAAKALCLTCCPTLVSNHHISYCFYEIMVGPEGASTTSTQP